MPLPLVTVICLCYNHERFIEEALRSVVNQTYGNIQLIVVDDGSTDASPQRIRSFLKNHPIVTFVELKQNHGMTRAFNIALKQSQGDYIVDFAGDDVFHPQRIEKQVHAFQHLDASYGVVFSDARLIDELSNPIGTFYTRKPDGTLQTPVPGGDVYAAILRSYCICAPTTLVRREVYDLLGGYDESLVYEDFDFFVRSARTYNYHYLDEPLTDYRKSAGSDSTKFYRKHYNPHLISTLAVCHKAYAQNKNNAENEALAFRVRYLLRQSFFTENFDLVEQYAQLLQKLGNPGAIASIIQRLARFRWRLGSLARWYFIFRNRQ